MRTPPIFYGDLCGFSGCLDFVGAENQILNDFFQHLQFLLVGPIGYIVGPDIGPSHQAHFKMQMGHRRPQSTFPALYASPKPTPSPSAIHPPPATAACQCLRCWFTCNVLLFTGYKSVIISL